MSLNNGNGLLAGGSGREFRSISLANLHEVTDEICRAIGDEQLVVSFFDGATHQREYFQRLRSRAGGMNGFTRVHRGQNPRWGEVELRFSGVTPPPARTDDRFPAAYLIGDGFVVLRGYRLEHSGNVPCARDLLVQTMWPCDLPSGEETPTTFEDGTVDALAGALVHLVGGQRFVLSEYVTDRSGRASVRITTAQLDYVYGRGYPCWTSLGNASRQLYVAVGFPHEPARSSELLVHEVVGRPGTVSLSDRSLVVSGRDQDGNEVTRAYTLP